MPSEHVYWELLHELADKDGIQTRVVVDVISGTSAGGINGVFLAKAIAHDLSQQSLRDLWFDEADIGKLLAGPRWLNPFGVKRPADLVLIVRCWRGVGWPRRFVATRCVGCSTGRCRP